VDVGAWLRGLGLERYEPAFRANGIDAEVLPELTAEHLKELGLPLGPRLKLLKAIAAFRAAPPTAGNDEPAASTAEVSESARPGAGAPEAERRQLTVMFVDLVGSTALSGRLDPEDMRAVIRAYQDACAGVITRFEGHVAKYMGDGVLAYFGYPKAHEDEAERAVRAGLGVVEAVGRLSAPDNGTPLAARVGIATGLVVVGELIGEGTAQERAAIGETPSLAARLQTSAAPGAVVIAPGTRRLLGGLFDLADLGRHTLKGFAAPVRSWRVLGPSAAEGRFEARRRAAGLTPLVGREHELALLLDRWHLAADGEGQVVLLSGEPGIGKSRLAQALHERLRGGGGPYLRLRYQCSPYAANSALHPVIGQLEHAAGFARDDPPEARLAKLEALLARSAEDVGAVAPLFAALLSVTAEGRYPPLGLTPQRQKELTLGALAAQLEGLARRQPVLTVFEDAHWIDPTSLELLERLVDRTAELPALLVVTFRPEFAPPPGWAGRAHVTALPLGRLSRRRGAVLVERVTGGKALPAALLDQIVAKSDGVPLFVEELTKVVLEAGMLVDAGDHYELDGPLAPLAIPATLRDSLTARLDRSAPVKEVAQLGAVIGREFGYELLAAVSPLTPSELRAALEELVASELVFARGASPETVYVFKHALVQDTAYATLLKSTRQQLHARIARALEERWPETRASRPELLAHHHTVAGLIERAVPLWLKAGTEALGRSAVAEAVAHLGRGLALIPRLPASDDRDRTEIELRVALGTAQMAHKGWPAAEVRTALEPARDLCRRLGETDGLVSVLWGLWANAAIAGDHARALRVAGEMTAGEATGHSRLGIVGRCAAALSREWTGRFLEARALTGEVLELYDPARHEALVRLTNHDPRCVTLQSAARTLWMLGYPDQAVSAFEEQLAHARRLGHVFNLCFGLVYGASVFAFRREPERQLAHLEEAMALATEQGFSPLLATGSLWRAFAEYELGRFEDALAHLRSGLTSWGGPSDRLNQPYRLALLARCLGRLGRLEEALVHIEDALHRAQRTDEGTHLAELWRINGELLLMSDRPDEAGAEACFARSLAVASAQRARGWELRATTSLARLWRRQGKRGEAHDLLAPVYGWFTEGLDTPDLREARALLDELAAAPHGSRARPRRPPAAPVNDRG
jgi:class 3 adenylate cyclase/predicted ATPase